MEKRKSSCAEMKAPIEHIRHNFIAIKIGKKNVFNTF